MMDLASNCLLDWGETSSRLWYECPSRYTTFYDQLESYFGGSFLILMEILSNAVVTIFVDFRDMFLRNINVFSVHSHHARLSHSIYPFSLLE
jgi:hypothetical protein